MHAHGNHSHDDGMKQIENVVIPIAIEQNKTKITRSGSYLYIQGNGVPNHKTGQFPNRNNPNSIQSQNHNFRVSLVPQMADTLTERVQIIGVALNGIPFEPGTAECYGRSRGQRGPMHTCEWREEAIVNGNGQLGLDWSNAHVQPDGTYHYHGVPNGLIKMLKQDGVDLVHVGYAADGFKLMVSQGRHYKSSYNLKSGKRPSGAPLGKYDGSYTADYEFVKGLGALNACNGTYINDEFVYFITHDFPFAPRCLMGNSDPSFAHKAPTDRMEQRRRHPQGDRRPPPRRGY